MLSKKTVLPNFTKLLIVATMVLGNVSAFAGHHEKGEKIGDLKDVKHNQTLKTDEMNKHTDRKAAKQSLTTEPKKNLEKHKPMVDKAAEVKSD